MVEARRRPRALRRGLGLVAVLAALAALAPWLTGDPLRIDLSATLHSNFQPVVIATGVSQQTTAG